MTGVTEAMKQDIALLLWNAPLNPSMAACLEIADRIIAMTTAALTEEQIADLEQRARAVEGDSDNPLRVSEANRLYAEAAALRIATAAPEKEIVELRSRIETAIKVIESGYRGVDKAELCPHERYGFEDCIACYDEALLSVLNPNAGEG